MTALTSIRVHDFHPDLELLVHPPAIDDDLATEAYEASCRSVDRFLQHTQIQKRSRSSSRIISEPLLSLSWSDVSVDRIMGIGGFASVCLVHVPKLDEQFNRQLPPNEQRRRWYALKCLNRNSSTDSKRFVRATSDLAMEATLLSRLNHENIIQLYGENIQRHNNKDSKETSFRQPGNFLVLQCMKQTLDGLIRTWASLPEKSITNVPSISQRIQYYGVGIANAVAYLHSKRILFRDLKPQNVGIDYEGKVRLFDFGIAQELPLDQDSIEGSCCGSLRYLAPEVLIHRRASFSSDVYSLGVLLWHLCTLQKPYEYAELKTPKDFRKQVGRNNMRPSMENGNPNANIVDNNNKQQSIPIILEQLLQQCWHAGPEKRPTSAQVLQDLLQMKKREATSSKPTILCRRLMPILGKVLERRRNRRRVMVVATSTAGSY